MKIGEFVPVEERLFRKRDGNEIIKFVILTRSFLPSAESTSAVLNLNAIVLFRLTIVIIEGKFPRKSGRHSRRRKVSIKKDLKALRTRDSICGVAARDRNRYVIAVRTYVNRACTRARINDFKWRDAH